MTLARDSISQAQPTRKAPPRARTYTGQIAWIFAFDIAYDMQRRPIHRLLGQEVASFAVDTSKRSPRQFFFYRPQMVRLPPLERLSNHGPIRLDRTIKLLPVGAISIQVRASFAVAELAELVGYHDLTFSGGGTLSEEVHGLADEIRHELTAYTIKPLDHLPAEEAYTVFCLNALAALDGSPLSAEDWFRANRREVAALLTAEDDPSHLSDQEVHESTGKHLSYYDRDLVVTDWDAALLVDEPKNFDETLHVMELANVQLAELEAYDRLLDDAVERAYRDLKPRGLFGKAARSNLDLREIRIDLPRLSDELSNITKFFGDWHLARVYQALSERFHLADWHRTLDEKLSTLGDMYQILQHDRNNRWMFILEFTVVLLFIIELALVTLHH